MKAVVVDAANDADRSGRTTSATRRSSRRRCSSSSRGSRRSSATAAPDDVRIFITGSGGAALAAAPRRQVRPGGQRGLARRRESSTRSATRSSSSAARTRRSSSSRRTPRAGRKKKIPSMNDKCAGGTGAVIDKITAKLQHPGRRSSARPGLRRAQAAPGRGQVRRLRRDRHQRPAEAGRAARRADGLALRGDRAAEPVRAHARPHAAADGAAARRTQHVHPRHGGGVARTTSRRCGRSGRSSCRDGRRLEDADRRPGRRAVLRGARRDRVRQGRRTRALGLLTAASNRSASTSKIGAATGQKKKASGKGLARDGERDSRAFCDQYRPEAFDARGVRARAARRGRSSASTAARPPPRRCSCSPEREILAKAYQLSKGNPIEDTIAAHPRAARVQVEGQGATLEVLGVGTTGYAKDILKDVLGRTSRSSRPSRTRRARCTSTTTST